LTIFLEIDRFVFSQETLSTLSQKVWKSLLLIRISVSSSSSSEESFQSIIRPPILKQKIGKKGLLEIGQQDFVMKRPQLSQLDC